LYKLNTYLIAGPQNINSETILKNETKESALIRLVTNFANDGLDVFQLRCKNFSKNDFYKIAEKIGSNLINTKCKFCINDDVDVTIMLKEKVNILHLGQDDMHPTEAKKMISDNVSLGLSITDIKQIYKIPEIVDYIGVGPIYKTDSKSDASKPMGVSTLRNIIKEVKIPVVAIGGLQLKNIPQLKQIGVSGFAIISAIFGEKDPQSSFKQYKQLAKF
jgi:thiamine-phosphate pyrophosphorylase